MKAVFFDFDGVIEDTFEIAYEVNSKFHNISKEEYRRYFNGNVYKEFDRDNRLTEQIIQNYFEEYSKVMSKLTMKSAIKQILDTLSESHYLCIVSSNSNEIMKSYLKKNNSLGCFREILGYEDHKSKTEKFKMLFKKYKPENCVFITDTVGDVLEANKVNLRSIAVTWGYHDKALLLKGKPAVIIDEFSELIPAVNRLLTKTI